MLFPGQEFRLSSQAVVRAFRTTHRVPSQAGDNCLKHGFGARHILYWPPWEKHTQIR
jgi:hypothetical protein